MDYIYFWVTAKYYGTDFFSFGLRQLNNQLKMILPIIIKLENIDYRPIFSVSGYICTSQASRRTCFK